MIKEYEDEISILKTRFQFPFFGDIGKTLKPIL